MFKQIVLISISALLLKVSSSFADSSHSASEQWTSNEKNSLDRANNLSSILNVGGYNNEQCFANTESLNPINLPLLPIIFAQSEDLPDGKCKEDAQQFLKELQNGTLWAVQSKYIKSYKTCVNKNFVFINDYFKRYYIKMYSFIKYYMKKERLVIFNNS